MRAVVGIDAGLCEAEALDGFSAYEVLLHNLFGIAGMDEAVPDGLGVDHDHRGVLALVKAAGLVDADAVLQTGGLHSIFEG